MTVFPPPRRRTCVVLFALMVFSYAYFFNPLGWNQAAKVDTMRAIVLDRTLSITAYRNETGDTIGIPVSSTQPATSAAALRIYSNKPPGTVFLGLPAWAAAHWIVSKFRPEAEALMFAQYASTLFAVGIPGAALVALVFLWLVRVTGRRVLSLVVSIGLGLGTIVFPFSTMHYSHVTAAAFLFAAFYLFWSFSHLQLSRNRGTAALCAAAALCSYSVVIEYSAGPPAAFILIYGAFAVWSSGDRQHRRAAIGILAAVVLLAGLPLLIYNVVVSGRLLFLTYGIFRPGPTGFRFSLDPIVRQLHLPSLASLHGVLFGFWRGLFIGSPWLLWSAAGMAFMARERAHRREAALFLAVFLFHLFCNTIFGDMVGYVNDFWGGEWSCGPRHLTTVLPFLAVGAAFWPRGAVIGVPLLLWSTFLMLVATSVDPRFDPRIPNPFFQYAISVFADGGIGLSQGLSYLEHTRFASGNNWNLGRLAGLSGAFQLLPLYVVWTGGVTFLLWDAGRGDGEPRPPSSAPLNLLP